MSPSLNHSYICKRIIIEIERSGKWEAFPELTLDIENGLVPDIAIYKAGALKPDFTEDKIRCDILPLCCIEILSTNRNTMEITDKFEIYFNAGVKSCWLVIPVAQAVVVYESLEKSKTFSSGNINDNILDITIPIENIFGF